MADETRLRELIRKPEGYTDEEIAELRSVANLVGNLGTDWRKRAQFRAAVETIAAIKQFDNASAALINTTNRLTKWVLGLTILGVLFAGGSVWLSYLAVQKCGH